MSNAFSLFCLAQRAIFLSRYSQPIGEFWLIKILIEGKLYPQHQNSPAYLDNHHFRKKFAGVLKHRVRKSLREIIRLVSHLFPLAGALQMTNGLLSRITCPKEQNGLTDN